MVGNHVNSSFVDEADQKPVIMFPEEVEQWPTVATSSCLCSNLNLWPFKVTFHARSSLRVKVHLESFHFLVN